MKYTIKRITTHIRERSQQRNLGISKMRLEIILNGGRLDEQPKTKEVHIYLRESKSYVVVTNEGHNQYNAVTIMNLRQGNTPEKQSAYRGATLIVV
jgi:hypothetical protein